MSVKSTLASAAVVLCGALALSACQSTTPVAVGGTPSAGTSSSAPSSAPSSASPSAPATSSAPASAPSSAPAHTTGGTGPAGSNATSDSYAYTHPCSIKQLTVNVTRLDDAPTRRQITVRNNGANSCGLSYYPRVDLGDSRSADAGHNVKPMIPGGLGGPPASPVHAGQTVYAVVDLDPTGATTGTVPGVDEMNVLPDSAMPDAATLNFPLGSGALVFKPKLGLYERSLADAVASMQGANTQQ